jgi:hypothetical protein
VPAGRGRKIILALAFLACVLAAVPAANAVTPAGGDAKKKLKFVFLRARVVSDGVVTPGQLETITVSRLAPRAPVKVWVEPPPTTPECGELYFCDPAPTVPAEGTAAYRSSGKGQAQLTFVVPGSYFVETNPFHPSEGHLSNFANGQSIHIDVAAGQTHRGVRRESFGFARGIVQLAP